MTIDSDRTRAFLQRTWDDDIVPTLTEYIRIPAKSPMFDAHWAEHGHLERAVGLITDWARRRKIEGLAIEVVRLPGRTPVILMEAPGTGGDTVLLYGHCDKQPEMVGWAADAGPWIPVRRGNRLFGRGAGDDGYAAFAALTAIEALQAQGVAHRRSAVLGGDVGRGFPLVPGMRPVTLDPVQALLNNTWRPALAVTGVDGMPALADAGNVLRPKTSLKLSLRLPPTADAPRAAQRVKEVLEAEPPYGARVTFSTGERPGSGWDAPVMADWLRDSVTRASRAYFNAPPMFDGLGGSIPFMSMLGERFPQAQFLVTGVMGPGSNAHGPNEFIDLPTGVKVTACVAQVLADHGRSALTAGR